MAFLQVGDEDLARRFIENYNLPRGILRTSQPRSQGLSSYRPLGHVRWDPGLVWLCATLTIESIREGSSVIRQFVALSFVMLWPPLTAMFNNSLWAEISNSIYSGVYLKVRQVCLDNLPWSWCCCRTHWIYGRSVIFQLWTLSSAILFWSDSYSTVVSPLNARDQTDPKKKTKKGL